MKIAQQHVAQSMTSMTAASTPENPSSSQELEAHLQDLCGGPSKENPPSRHPARCTRAGLRAAGPGSSASKSPGRSREGRGQNRVSARQGHGSSLEHSCREPPSVKPRGHVEDFFEAGHPELGLDARGLGDLQNAVSLQPVPTSEAERCLRSHRDCVWDGNEQRGNHAWESQTVPSCFLSGRLSVATSFHAVSSRAQEARLSRSCFKTLSGPKHLQI